MSTTTQSRTDKIRDLDEKSAQALIRANQLKYSNPALAEVWYDLSAMKLMEANDLREQSTTTHTQG